MSAEFELLEASLRRAVADDGNISPGLIHTYEDETEKFINLDDNPEITTPVPLEGNTTTQPSDGIEPIRPERRPLILPSTSLPLNHSLSKLELHLCQQQAN